MRETLGAAVLQSRHLWIDVLSRKCKHIKNEKNDICATLITNANQNDALNHHCCNEQDQQCDENRVVHTR